MVSARGTPTPPAPPTRVPQCALCSGERTVLWRTQHTLAPAHASQPPSRLEAILRPCVPACLAALLQRKCAAPDFVATYQRAKEAQKAARRARKQAAAFEAVADPELAAKKRMARNMGKQRGKKRKLEQVKRARDSSGSIGVGSRKRKRAGASF